MCAEYFLAVAHIYNRGLKALGGDLGPVQPRGWRYYLRGQIMVLT